MRRADREIKDRGEIERLIKSFGVMRVGYSDSGEAYIVPVDYLPEFGDGISLYFHGAAQGRKYELSKSVKSVSFEMDRMLSHAEKRENEFTTLYESVMGRGIIAEIEDLDEKRRVLSSLVRRYFEKEPLPFSSELVMRTAIFKIDVTSVQAKRHS